MEGSTEIRHLQAGCVFKLCQILDEFGWKEVMAVIPSNPLDIASSPKYSVEQMQLVESESKKLKKSCTEILLQEWGTSGKVRPTIQTLFNVLKKAELFRAADYVAVDIMKISAPDRPVIGPAAVTSVNLEQLPEPNIGNFHVIDAPENIPHIPHSILCLITNNFSEQPCQKMLVNDEIIFSGNKLGSGAFGAVYYGKMPDGRPVAVKRLMNDAIGLFQQFQTEITTLSFYKHPNLLPLLGFSCDSSEFCIVYEFMSNFSLLERLKSDKSDSTSFPLNWQTRLNIALGLCRGVHYLHTARSTPLIHRDIKSANILLDSDLSARLGDFGLVKTSPTDSRLTSTVFGTSAYMAPEAFRGDVSVKMDVFSTGVVLLELLTALPPYDDVRESADIITFIEGAVEDSIVPLLDPLAKWDELVADEIFAIAQKCLEDKKHRPLISSVLESLTEIFENISNV